MPNFPSSADSLSNPTGSQYLGTPSVLHSTQHGTVNDIVESIEDMLVGNTWINVKHRTYAATGDSVADDRTAINSASVAAAALTFPCAILLPPGTYRIATNLTIASPVFFMPGAKLAPDVGVTVTLSQAPRANALQQIFIGSGTLALSKTETVYPQWWGATGLGVADDTAAIQAAVNAGLDIYIPDGTYIIDTNLNGETGTAFGAGNFGGIKLRSNMRLVFGANALFKAKGTTEGRHSILRLWDISNVVVYGGKLQGVKLNATKPASDEHGYNVDIRGSSDITFYDTESIEAWGDGFFIGHNPSESTNVRLLNVIADNNRRNGCSVVGCNGFVITGIFKNTESATSGVVLAAGPHAGIDVEPDAGKTGTDGYIQAYCDDNDGNGLILNTLATDCVIGPGKATGNGASGLVLNGSRHKVLPGYRADSNTQYGIEIVSDDHTIDSATTRSNGASGLILNGAERCVINDLLSESNTSDGIRFTGSASRNRINSPRLHSNTGTGIQMTTTSNENVITKPVIRLNGTMGIDINGCLRNEVDGGYVGENSQTTNNTSDNIIVRGTTPDGNYVQGVTVRKGSLANKPRIGINLSTGTGGRAINNDVSTGGETVVFQDVATSSVVRNNVGWATEANLLSAGFAIDATGVKTVTTAHGLNITPTLSQVRVSVVEDTNVDDWAYNLLKVESVDGVNVVCKINVSTQSATGAATAKLSIRVEKV